MNRPDGRSARALVTAIAFVSTTACNAVLDLRDDYQLATDGGGSDVSVRQDARSNIDATRPRDAGVDAARPRRDATEDATQDAPGTPDVAQPREATPRDTGTVDAGTREAGIDAATITAVRLLSPFNTATTSTQKPRITWELPKSDTGVDGAHVEFCKDRACTSVQASFDATGNSGAPMAALAPGLHYFRAAGRVGAVTGTSWSATWEIHVPFRSAAHDTSYGAFPDFNGDGYAEILTAGGNSYDVDIFSGKAQGPAPTPIKLQTEFDDAGVDQIPQPTFGDIDGDGYSDLVVGVGVNAGGKGDSTRRIEIYAGSANGLSASSTPSWVIHVPAAPHDAGASSDAGDSSAPHATYYTQFASVVTVPGDVNGDGYADILASSQVGASLYGPTFVFFGHATGPSPTPDAVLDTNGQVGTMMPAGPIGDINGDGYADVLCVSQPNYGSGALLFLGGPNGPSDATAVMITVPSSAFQAGFGSVAPGAGDLDGDGFPDIAIGATNAPRADAGNGAAGTGQVYVYRGGQPAGTLGTVAWTLAGPAGDGSGFGVPAIVGDVNADGYDDLVVGFTNSATGAAYYYAGGVSGPATAVKLAVPGSDWAGAAQGGDIDGDGVVDAILDAPANDLIVTYYGSTDAGLGMRSTTLTVTNIGFLYILAQRAPLGRHVWPG